MWKPIAWPDSLSVWNSPELHFVEKFKTCTCRMSTSAQPESSVVLKITQHFQNRHQNSITTFAPLKPK